MKDDLKARVAAMSNDEKDDFVKFIFDGAKLSERCQKMDDRELLWWTVKVPLKNVAFIGIESHLLTALEDRLYPAYDGEKVQITPTGWKTPEGEVNYSKIAL